MKTWVCLVDVVKFSLREWHLYQSQTSYRVLHNSVLQIVGNLRVINQGCRVDGVILSNKILWWLPESSNLCATLHCHAEARFLLNSCHTEFVWNAEFCQCRDVGVRSDCLPSLHGIHKNHAFTVPEDSDHDLVFWGDLRWWNSKDCLFGVQFKMIGPGFICCDHPG